MAILDQPPLSETVAPRSHTPDPALPPAPAQGRRGRRAARPGALGELRRRVYDRSELSGYSLRDRLLIHAADLSLSALIRFIGSTLRWQVRGGRHLDAVYASNRRAIFTSWHMCIFSATWFWRNRGIVVMSSQSRDGEYIGRFIQRCGYGRAPGSATRGGARAMALMAECLANGIDAGFTIDGPRGPAFVAKPGAVTLARHTGQVILPFHVGLQDFWALRSWDRLQIPKPFTRAVMLIAQPINVPRDATAEEVAQKQAELQAVLDALREEGERWRNENRAQGKM